MSKIQALAYVVAETTDLTQWQQYSEQVLGLAVSATGNGLHLKADERKFRIAVVKGAADRYIASGWEVANAQDFADTVTTLEKAGVKVERGNDALKQSRCVTDLVTFTDPSGNLHELTYGYIGGESSFVSPIAVSGFKTGAQGIGHTVLPAAQDFDGTLKLFRDVLGFGLSDVFNFKPAPEAPNMRIYFLHAASGRHHSLALAEMPNPAGCVHIMLEVNSMTEVGLAYDRLSKQGVKLMATLGQHENDKMTSFYMMTPSNFALEYGWGGITVDPQTWQTTETKQVSIWGHDFSVGFR